MIVQKTFEQWLQQFNSALHIEEVITKYVDPKTNEEHREKNSDIENLYYKNEFLGCVPRGSKRSKTWTDVVNDERQAVGYTTTDGAYHKSLPGIGKQLLNKGLITKFQFQKHFLSDAIKIAVRKAVRNMIQLNPDQITQAYRKTKL